MRWFVACTTTRNEGDLGLGALACIDRLGGRIPDASREVRLRRADDWFEDSQSKVRIKPHRTSKGLQHEAVRIIEYMFRRHCLLCDDKGVEPR